MTDDEALKVAELIAKADGGCPYCVAILIGHANVVFPDHNWKRLVRFIDPTVLEFPDDASKIFDYRESVRSTLEHARRVERPLGQVVAMQRQEAMQDRHDQADRLFAEGKRLIDIARELRISRTTVRRWYRSWQGEGSSIADGASERLSS